MRGEKGDIHLFRRRLVLTPSDAPAEKMNVPFFFCRCLLLLAFVALDCLPGEEETLTFPELYHKLSTNVVTPHIAWAKPWSGKKLKVLVIAPRWGQRETVELTQRFDINCTPFLVYSPEKLFCTANGWGHEKPLSIKKDAVLGKLAAALKENYDVIVIGLSPLKEFPPDAIDALKAKLRAGTGLVYLWPNHLPNVVLNNELRSGLKAPGAPGMDPATKDEAKELIEDKDATLRKRLHFVTTGVPFERLAGFRVKDRNKDMPAIVTLQEYGKGRVALVQYRDGGGYEGHVLTPAEDDDLHYEYCQSFLIKAILWAARQEPAIAFESFPERLEGGNPLTFVLRNDGEPVEAVVSLSVRSPDILHRLPEAPWAAFGVHQTEPLVRPVFARQEKMTLAKGARNVTLQVPELPEGEYFADVEIATEKGKVNWATTALHVSADFGLARLALTPDTLDFAAGGPQSLKAAVALSKPAPEGATLRLALLDNYHRLLDQQELKLPGGAQAGETTLTAAAAGTTLLKVRAELAVAGRCLSIKSARATAIHRGWDAFTFFAWGGPGGNYVGRQRFRELAALGIEAVRGEPSLRSLEVADIRTISDLCRFNGRADKATNAVVPCFSSSGMRADLLKSIESAVARDAKFDNFSYLLGDEFAYCGGGLTGGCCSETCVKRLAAFLKERYQTVEALNRQWDASYRSFDDVLGLGHPQNKDKDAQTEAMRRTGNYSPLIDQWLSNYATFVDAIAFCRENLQRLESRTRLGISTPLWNYYYRGYDWANIMGVLTYATPYGPWGDYSNFESIRSFARPGTILSAHYGSYVEPCLNDEEHFRMVPYAVLLRGGANVFWYTTWSNEGGVSPWLDPYPCLLRSSEEIRKIKQGPGKLLLGARRANDGIAIHSSQASFLFSFAVSGPAVPWRINGLVGALQELGLQYELVSSDQILAGALRNYRALIMPVSQCVGDAEAAKIREFVENGGLAIADVRPGIADGHGRIGAKAIPQLFGLKWGPELLDDPETDPKKKAKLRPMKEVTVRFAGTFAGKAFQGPEIEKTNVDPVQSLDGAEAALNAGGIPVLTRRVCGKGAAVCLNADVYPSNPRVAANARNLLFLVLSAHGIEPAASIEDREEGFSPGAWIPGLEVARADDGEAKYCGVVRRKLFDAGDAFAGRLRLRFGSSGHVYDMRLGRYLGNVDNLDLTAAPSSARLFALLPYRVEKLKVDLAKPAVRAGETVMVSVEVVTDGKPAGRHVIHLEARRPDGQTAMYLAQCAEAKEGKARLAIPLAINEPAGEWQLRLTDAATKVSESVKMDVKPAR